MNPQIQEEKPMTQVEVRHHLLNIHERDGELNFRANKTLENLNTLVHIDQKVADELRKKLEELEIPRLKDVHICKIIDIIPTTVDQLKVVLQGYTVTVTQDNMKKIVEVIKDTVPNT